MAQIPTDSWLGRTMARALHIAGSASSMEEAWEPLHTEFWTPVHSAVTEALPQIYALLQLTNADYQRAMFWGCNFECDADTIGAVLGRHHRGFAWRVGDPHGVARASIAPQRRLSQIYSEYAYSHGGHTARRPDCRRPVPGRGLSARRR